MTRRLALALTIAITGYVGLFAVMHFESLSWGVGSVLDSRTLGEPTVGRVELLAAKRTTAGLYHGLYLGVVLTLATAGYLLALRATARAERAERPVSLRTLLIAAAVCGIPLLFLPNLLSSDVYSYMAYGRIPVVHGANPYLVAPSAFPNDPYLSLVFWKDVNAAYGPAWVLLSMAVTFFVEQTVPSAAGYVLTYKLLALGFHLGSGALVWRIASDAAPRHRSLATAIWLLSPLCLIELVGSGHNDAFMVFLLLAGLRAAQRDRRWLAIALLAVASLAKIYALPILGLYACVLLWRAHGLRERLRIAGTAAAIVGGVAVMLYAPFWQGTDTFALLRDPSQRRAVNSTVQLIGIQLLEARPGGSASVSASAKEQLLATLRLIMLGIVGAGGLLAAWRARSWDAGVRGACWYALLFCCFGASWFWPWYAIFGVAMAAIAGNVVPARAVLLLTMLVPYMYVTAAIEVHAAALHRWRALLMFGPPLVLAAVESYRLRGGSALRQPVVGDTPSAATITE